LKSQPSLLITKQGSSRSVKKGGMVLRPANTGRGGALAEKR
jgi:hypothetical protein